MAQLSYNTSNYWKDKKTIRAFVRTASIKMLGHTDSMVISRLLALGMRVA
jgi:hypothetical protein